MANKFFNNLLGTGSAAFTPADVPGLFQWFAADDIVGLNDGDPVTTWTKSGGTGGNATQSSAGAKPSYQTNVVNSLPAVEFDGTADFLELGNMSALTAGRIFIVMKLDADPPVAGDGLWTIGSDVAQSTRFPFSDGNAYDQCGTTARKATGNPTPDLATWNIYSVKSITNNWTSYFNGVQHYTTGTNTVGFATAAYLGRSDQSGADFWFDGLIAEYAAYSEEPSSDNVTALMAYWTAKYGL